jgi:hypothetical protein
VKLPRVEAQTHRRFMKTHLPVDALVFSPEAHNLKTRVSIDFRIALSHQTYGRGGYRSKYM